MTATDPTLHGAAGGSRSASRRIARRLVGPGLGLALAAAAGGAWAEPPPGPRRGPPPIDRMLERHAERLGLDQAVRAEIQRIGREAFEASRALQDERRALRQELRALLDAEPPDEARVMDHAERMGETDTALRKHRLRTLLEIRALLTPEQRRELVEIHEERRARFLERRAGGGRPPAADAEPDGGPPFPPFPPFPPDGAGGIDRSDGSDAPGADAPL